MTTNIDTVIFDLGGVLIDWNPEYVFREVFDDHSEMQYFLREVCSPEWNEQQDAGRTLQEATEILVAQFPDYELQIRTYYNRWQDMLGGTIPHTVEILRHLHQKQTHRLYALTNWSHETFPVALELFDFLHLFEGILVSGEEKLLKPDRRIYELLLTRYEIDGQRALFIDDNPKNVKGAQDAGLNAIRFESPEQLAFDLKNFNIL
ncbi:MAG: HAD family phosphatase [Saprospiraceae bacterium]|nr:HAD family phosphatase [Saprospiraceae bacterium]MDZ4704979.1 HAD family phosphatase [Saprospiraceae bacterium]